MTELERLILDVSTMLTAAPASQVDEAVRRALALLRERVGVERVAVVLVSPDGTRLDATHEDNAQGLAPVSDAFRNVSTAEIPHEMEMLRAGQVMAMPRVSDLPPEAVGMRELMGKLGSMSCLVLPLLPGGTFIGTIGWDWVTRPGSWTEEHVRSLRLVGEAIGATLARARAEKDLRAAEERLRQAQKMESIGLLAGGLAHDFNNLLVVIMSSAQLALRDLARDPADVRADIEKVCAAADKAAGLTRQLLTFGSRRSRERQIVDVTLLVGGLAGLVRGMMPSGVTLNIDGPPGALIQGDAAQLEQALVNLCRNAADSLAGGVGTIDVSVRRVELSEEEARRHPEARAGSWIVLEVADTGSGIAPEARARIFEPFFTTKAPGQGTGLGLAVVYGAVHQQGGFVELETTVGKGTTFRLYFPAATTPTVRPQARRQPTILLAEDDATLRRVMTETLEEAGFTVLVARDGSEAIRMFDVRAGAVDLVLLDLVMPILGGKAVLDHVLARRADARVLITTGHATQAPGPLPDDAHVELLLKPYDGETLLDRIHKALA